MAWDGLNKSFERGAVTTEEGETVRPFRIKWETILGWLVAALLAYAAVDRRVYVLESKTSAVEEQLKEIRTDLKELLRRQ